MCIPTFRRALSAVCLMLSMLFTTSNFATTIVPFPNLGQLALHCDAVVLARMIDEIEITEAQETRYRSRLKVLENLKGQQEVGTILETQKWEMRIGNLTRKMYGDIELEEGVTYLLFLKKTGDNLFHPLCFSYYIFEERMLSGVSYLVPSSQEGEFILVDDVKAEPLYIFKKRELVAELKSIVSGNGTWNHTNLIANLDLNDNSQLKSRSAPAHCSFLGAGNNFRWKDFPSVSLPVHYQASGDGVCAAIPSFIGSAISTLNQNYSGINLTNGGGFSGFSPNCGSAHGASFRDYVNQTYGDNRRILIQFNDPCSELPNLQNCGGTLAVGGLFGYGTHEYKGEDWFTGAYGYVIINNGVGQCYCDPQDYEDLIVHELSHSLGLGHIGSANGMANMNPFCCNSIQTLDLQCMDYSYESGTILPVSLTTFTGVATPKSNLLSWVTSSEQNVESFILERSSLDDLGAFSEVGRIAAIGNSEYENRYEHTDHEMNQQSYYRLKIRDLDGSIDYSEIISITRPHIGEIKLFPTLVGDEFFVQLESSRLDKQASSLSIADLTGRILYSKDLVTDLNCIKSGHLVPGIYMVSVSGNGKIETFRIQKH